MSNREKVKLWADAYNKQLKATDFSPSQKVIVHSIDDISHHVFDSAFVLVVQTQHTDESYYVVFAEHDDFAIYHSEEYNVEQLESLALEYKVI